MTGYIMKKISILNILLCLSVPYNACSMDNSYYHSTYKPTPIAESVLRTGKIISSDETPQKMMERVVSTLFLIESRFKTSPHEIQQLSCEFGGYLDAEYCVMSTPILTNAGRYINKPLSACTVPPIDLRKSVSLIKKDIDLLHQDGMGTGFNLDDCNDPVKMLRTLNEIAVTGAASGKEDRPVGNIAVLSINHPQIEAFIEAKNNVNQTGEEWKFNISVNIDEAFMKAFINNTDYTLRNGKKVSAQALLKKIAQSIHICADPGILFLDRVNQGNPTPAVGNYIAVAPCGEVGLAAGESCQFGYINIAKFFIKKDGSKIEFDFDKLKRVTQLMVRALDNALEVSIDHYAFSEQQAIMRAKRKIGIGICGLADLLIRCGLSYADQEARILAQDIVAFINYHSKLASHELAKVRGSFEAMSLTKGCRYNENPGYIEQRYGKIVTPHVSTQMWQDLAKIIRETKLLRNASTIALPPTGRSAMLINASQSIEPYFSLVEISGSTKALNPLLEKVLSENGILTLTLKEKIYTTGNIEGLSEIPQHIRHVFKTGSNLSAEAHISMLETLQTVVDESISKTVNVSESTSVQEIEKILYESYAKGLKGITIYRDGSRIMQPKNLGKTN
jgi:ribonucleoside-diphosphate reductase alpha chain